MEEHVKPAKHTFGQNSLDANGPDCEYQRDHMLNKHVDDGTYDIAMVYKSALSKYAAVVPITCNTHIVFGTWYD